MVTNKKKGKWLIQYVSPEGNKITISMEGNFSSEKVKQITELLELMDVSSGISSDKSDIDVFSTSHERTRRNIKELLLLLLERDFKNCWFSSKDVAEAYYKTYGERLPINVVSSYLSRLYHSGVLSYKGSRLKRLYCINS
ncbi:MAG: hypothetical protein NZ926_01705 [Candidatus Methanomethylicia archaeon]|nr:hypothetical protein [Candidatus Methanomethylicia archaeon]MCX8169135.1 hypothetical protein [Candidatus Methanomethylicia archaeon]MDW7988867.1 hypothetical protein [Nitrososphaerota archaeon]